MKGTEGIGIQSWKGAGRRTVVGNSNSGCDYVGKELEKVDSSV